MATRDERAQYKKFEKDLDIAVKGKIKGTGWKKKSFTIFREIDGQFYVVSFIASMGGKVNIRIMTKDMSLDRLFWEIFQLPDNVNQPLSFRAWGAFTCPAVWIYEESKCFESSDLDAVAGRLIELAEDVVSAHLKQWTGFCFSEKLLKSPLLQERGPYAVSLVVALINEGKLEKARDYALKYESGELAGGRSKRHFHGDSFERLAINWIEERL